ncbi:MAG: SCO family protein [Saprospiraceae bacterium]
MKKLLLFPLFTLGILVGNLEAQDADTDPNLAYFTDVELVNQHGETLRFYSDLLQGKTVLINVFFTECTGICPAMNTTISSLQNSVEGLGDSVHFISITVDRENDTVEKLREYAQKYNAQPGWHFLTGEKENLEFILRKIGAYVENRDEHNSIFVIGNLRTGLWKKGNGLAPISEIRAVLESVINDQG